MASLAGRSLVSSYKELLKLNNASLNSGISGTLQTVEDGFAGATALQLSNAGLASTGTLASSGDFSVNTNKFNVTAASGNTTVAGTLSATGDLAVNTNKFTVAAASGNTSIAGTLGVTGATTLAALGATSGTFSSNLSATGNLAINTDKFVVTAASGNTSIAGTLGVTGATTLAALGATSGTFSSTLSATGNLAINTNKFNVTASSGNTSIAGTLTVSDYSDFNSTGAIRLPRGIDGERPAGLAGMLRFNTGSQSFEGHNGLLWGAIGGSGSGGSSQYVRQTFTATAGQTTFTVTGGYTPERVDVFQNGVKLVNGSGNDVTVTSGTNIVLATGAAAGDIIDVVGLASGNFAGPATAKRQNFTATAGQTVFTVTGGYTPGQLDVFQNGTKLLNSVDVDVSNGSTFTLTTGANAGDSVEVVGFTAADTISGTLKFQDGTAAAPSITSFNDTNTGIFWPAADTLAAATNGAERIRIDSSGNVGVGTTSPTAKLHSSASNPTRGIIGVFGNSASSSQTGSQIQLTQGGIDDWAIGQPAGVSAFSVWSGRSTGGDGTERLRIDSSGNVGIGCTAASTVKLDVQGGVIRGKEILLENGTASSPALGTTPSWYSPASGVAALSTNGTERLRIDSSGNVEVKTAGAKIKLARASDASLVGEIGSQSGTGISIKNIGGTTSEAVIGGDWFAVNTNNTERLRIDSSGNVGIGTTSPQKELQIKATEPTIRLEESGAGSKRLELSVNSAAEAKIFANQSGGTLILGTVSTERLRIDSNGAILLAKNTTSLGTVGYRFDTTGENYTTVNASTNATVTNAIYSASASAYRFYVGLAGTVYATNTTISAISDMRYKENIRDLDIGLNSIMALKPRVFDWKDGRGKNIKNDRGFIAQEFEQVFPDLVDEWKDEAPQGEEPYKSVRQDLIPVLVKAIQELKTENDSFKSRIAALEAA